MLPYLLILFSTSSSLVEGTVIKHYNRKHKNGGFLFTAFVSTFSMLFFVVMYLLTDGEKSDFTPLVIPYSVVAGIAYCSASFLTYLALQIGPFSISMLVLSFGTVLSSISGIVLLGEEATLSTYIGIALIVVCLFLLKKSNAEGEKKDITPAWVLCIGASVILSHLFTLMTRLQLLRFGGAVNNEYKIIALGLSSVLLFIAGFATAKGRSGEIIKTGLPYATVAGLANGATNLLGLLVASMLDLSLTSATSMITKNILTFAIAVLIFKERMPLRRILGLVVGMVAVLFINLRF